MIRKILVPIRGDGQGANVLGHASILAHRFNAHVEAMHCRPRPEDMLPFGVPIPGFMREQILASGAGVADQEEARLKAQFDRLIAELGLRASDGMDATGPTVSWREEQGRQVDVIKTHGRLADMIAVPKPDRDRNLGANTLKSALFHTGRPVLMCPPAEVPPETLGKRVAIAWNGSTEVARAVALTLDLIAGADEVVVLCAGEELHGATSDELLRYLRLRGIDAQVERFAATGRIGVALLDRAVACGADLLVMGAYSDSHEHETIFGGNTQAVVDRATTPVVLVH